MHSGIEISRFVTIGPLRGNISTHLDAPFLLVHLANIPLNSCSALDTPFFLLPFRPLSDPSAARTFIRNYFNPPPEKATSLHGEALMQELRLTEPMVRDTLICTHPHLEGKVDRLIPNASISYR